MLFALLVCLGFVGGFLSGLLGVGGGIIMVPLLLCVAPRAALLPLDMRHVAGITIVQVFAATLLGYVVYRRRRLTDSRVVWLIG